MMTRIGSTIFLFLILLGSSQARARTFYDVVLLERDELTSGSTWHAAGLLPYFNMSYATTHIHDYSIKYYKTLEEETGLNPGFYVVGNLAIRERPNRHLYFGCRAPMDQSVV